MSQSLSCPLCGAALKDASEKVCLACGGRVVPESSRPANFTPDAKSRIGDYFIECHIGSGGMGEVYLARQISMKREVALKILQRDLTSDSKYLDRFFREVRLLAQLEHPNVVRAIEAGMEGDTCFFSMEYAHGKDLKRQIDLGRRFGEQDALRIACEIGAALSYAWEKHKLIHRDVKPANIILTPDGEVKLMDLGISKRQFEASDITLDGMMVGSPTYISPEQARAEKDMDFRADMYSLGATLFHLLAGKPPYDADSPVAVISMHLGAPIPDVRSLRPDISKATALLIMRMMAKDKDERFLSWDDAIDQMESIMERSQTSRLRKADSPDATKLAQPRSSDELPVRSHLNRLLSWRPSLLNSQPKHRLFALLGLLVLILLAFGSVVNRSIKDAKAAENHRILQSAIAAAETCAPESRPNVIARLEAIAQTAPPEIAKAAIDAIEHLRKRTLEEREAELVARREKLLRAHREKADKLELSGDLDGAIRLWTLFKEYPEIKDDQSCLTEADNALGSIKRQKQKREAGLE